MNCKPGDLAVLIRSWAGNEGKVVTCVRLHGSEYRDTDGDLLTPHGPRWVIDRPLPSSIGGLVYTVAD